MKTQSMLEMAYFCGLHTIEEAHLNITRHSMSLFPYQDINSEERELIADMAIRGMLEENDDGIYIIDAKVEDFLSVEDREKVDREMEEYFQRDD
jgi:hypothetical protein